MMEGERGETRRRDRKQQGFKKIDIMTDRKYSVKKKAGTKISRDRPEKLHTSKLNFLKLKEQQSIQYTRTFSINILTYSTFFDIAYYNFPF